MTPSSVLLWHSRWLGPGILVVSALLLALLGGDIVLYWLLFVAALGLAAGSQLTESRWLVALPGVFIVSLLAFFLQGADQPLSNLAVVACAAGLGGLSLWVLGAGQVPDVAIAYASAIAMAELFALLLFWPINNPSRSLVLTSAVFLLFEFVDRRSRGLGFHEILGTVGLVVVTLVAVTVTADWQTF